MLDFKYWNIDRSLQEGETRGDACGLLVPFGDSKLRGFYLTPNHREGEKHPVVIMFHGFPGITNNHDLGEALRRCGFIVVNPYAPGSWGSDGVYTVDGIVNAAVTVCKYVRSDEFCKANYADPDRISVFGHSMGGFVVANIMKRLDWIKTGVLLTPYNVSWYFANDMESGFTDIIDACDFLRTKYGEPCGTEVGRKVLLENARRVWKDLDYSEYAEDLADRNLYFIGADFDTCAQTERMIEPLWVSLQAIKPDDDASGQSSPAPIRLWENYPTDHGFNDSRLLLCEKVCSWLCSLNRD